jgi:hypothetical protein
MTIEPCLMSHQQLSHGSEVDLMKARIPWQSYLGVLRTPQ